MDSDRSTSSGFEGLENLEPLELDDIAKLSVDRRDRLEAGCMAMDLWSADTKFFNVAMKLKRKYDGMPQKSVPVVAQPKEGDGKEMSRGRMYWKKALRLIRERGDPWKKFALEKYPVEKVTRYRYNALTKQWKKDECVVKIEEKPFAHGAMRECYRMKKLSNFSQSHEWNRDSNNYVAKCYMDENVSRETYFEDVKLQMDAKLWAEEYNRHNPPKKVDIYMMAILEFHDRKGKPLFHIEHYIDGEYIKYNSNSGFVETSAVRQTPHAFSHFTFERSGHELIVVDIQGVGDLYTDPQIHTADGHEYGDGNLGTKGMALFFHSHQCNDICKSLKLTRFDLTKLEKQDLSRQSSSTTSSMTSVKGNEKQCDSPGGVEHFGSDFAPFFRARSNSGFGLEDTRPHRTRTFSDYYSMEESPPSSAPIYEGCPFGIENKAGNGGTAGTSGLSARAPKQRRQRTYTESSEDSGIRTRELASFQEIIRKKARPSNVGAEMDRKSSADLMQDVEEDSILGQVHLDLAKYHEICRFCDDGNYDKAAAFFHLKCAADCGLLEAIIAMAKIYFGMPHDILADVDAPEEDEDERLRKGLNYMTMAALAQDRSSMVFVAKAFDTGMNLGKFETQSVRTALHWYEKISEMDEQFTEDDIDWGMDDPSYLILARQAEIHRAGREDEDLPKDPNRAGELYSAAAEAAMACMKGKLANKYYMLAEEAWGEVEEL